MAMNFTVPTYIIVAYAPTAEGEEALKTQFYSQLTTQTHRFAKKGTTYVLGDFNARLHTRVDENET
eukprot:11060110-Karenia_brevis.AAC.1